MALAKQFQKELANVFQHRLESHGVYSIEKVTTTKDPIPLEEIFSADRGAEELVQKVIRESDWRLGRLDRVTREPNGSGTFPDWQVFFKDGTNCLIEVKNTYKNSIGQSMVSFGTLEEFSKSLRRAGNSYRSKYFDATYICLTGRGETSEGDAWVWAGVEIGKVYELSRGGVHGRPGRKRLTPSVSVAGSRKLFLEHITPALITQELFHAQKKDLRL